MFLLPASSRARVVFCALAFLIFLLVPGAPDSEFAGMPVTGPALLCFLGSVVVLIFIAMFAPLRRIGVGWAIALIGLAVVKAVLAPWTFPEGWRAAYEVIDLRGTAPISFIDGPSARPFRIDRRIDFNGPFFNLPFFNDIFRYSEHFSPLRRDVEFSFRVQWTGYTVLDEQEPLSFTVSCVGDLSFNVDTKSEFDGKCPGEGSFNISTRILPKGPHLIQARYTKPPFSTPRAVIQPDGPWRILPVRVSPRAASRSATLTQLTTVLGWGACALLLLSLWRAYSPVAQMVRIVATEGLRRIAVVAAFTILLALAVDASLGYRNVTVNILTGDDPFAYEGFARDIFFNGLLMPSWKAPFYFYPFYPYVLTVAHIVFGEDLSSAVVLHGLCLASLALLFWRLGWKHLPVWGLAIGLVALGYYCRKYYFPFMLNAYTDHLFAALAFVAIGASVWALTSGVLVCVVRSRIGDRVRSRDASLDDDVSGDPRVVRRPWLEGSANPMAVRRGVHARRWLSRWLAAVHDSQLARERKDRAARQLMDSDSILSLCSRRAQPGHVGFRLGRGASTGVAHGRRAADARADHRAAQARLYFRMAEVGSARRAGDVGLCHSVSAVRDGADSAKNSTPCRFSGFGVCRLPCRLDGSGGPLVLCLQTDFAVAPGFPVRGRILARQETDERSVHDGPSFAMISFAG